MRWTYVISDLNDEETVIDKSSEIQEFKKKNQKGNYKCKCYGNLFNIRVEKNPWYKNESHFPKPHKRYSQIAKVKLNLSNYLKKEDLKRVLGVDNSNLAEKSGLASLKAEIDEEDMDKHKTVTTDLSNLSNEEDNNVDKNPV